VTTNRTETVEQAQTVRPDVDAVVDDLGRRLSNWGRWGDDDALGTLNLVTEAKRIEGAAAVRTGRVVSLAVPLQPDWPQVPGGGRLNAQHVMVETGTDALASGRRAGYSDDMIAMSVHAHTHWDALSHVFHRGFMFNGHSAAMVTAQGAARNDIVPVSRTMATRGVLLDLVPHDTRSLEPGCEITVDDLEQALERQQVNLHEGDALLLRTGHLGRVRESRAWTEFSEVHGVPPHEPGIGCSCLPWLHDRGIAAVACDNWAVEILRGPETTRMPVHEIGIVHMGLLLGEMFDLDGLTELCTSDGHWDFLLAAGPLPIEGGVGGPVNPMALR
jgi:kynurenine formamidase